jgi:hypothetical protein
LLEDVFDDQLLTIFSGAIHYIEVVRKCCT